MVDVTGIQLGYSSFCKAAADGQQIGGITVQYTQPPRCGRVVDSLGSGQGQLWGTQQPQGHIAAEA